MFKFAFLKSFSGPCGEDRGIKGKNEYCSSGRQSCIVRDEAGTYSKTVGSHSGRSEARSVVGSVQNARISSFTARGSSSSGYRWYNSDTGRSGGTEVYN